ncbi:hypothetical protein EIP91_008214 [Steccherinum ochraceum]|uniref:Fungal-type protein kinase domain-containing protein n=1 Tax=Steccherinum ochraceum TaxID=92696 RepID=A0A4R0RU94_9APHY|nr:hypothetical protein EIP91_008214 [Steccherinum ochraceum]
MSDTPPPPSPTKAIKCESSPLRTAVAGVEEYGADVHTAKEKRPLFAAETRGKWAGPMELTRFFEVTLKTDKELPDALLSSLSFNAMPEKPSTEGAMYKSFMEVIESCGLLPWDIQYKDTSSLGEASTGLKPDGALVYLTAFDKLRFEFVEVIFEFKRDEAADIFRSWEESGGRSKVFLELLSATAEDTKGQIASYVAAILARQHRIFIFVVIITGHRARFIRFDRAGALVSESFNYRRQPKIFAEFLWRYGSQSRAGRGFDPTVLPATEEEETRLFAAVQAYIKNSRKRQVPEMTVVVDRKSPYLCYKLAVRDSTGTTRSFIVQKPFSLPLSVLGRCTRAYVALDLSTGKLVCVKDYWRLADASRPAEAAIYKLLSAAEVPHLPNVLLAGDVLNEDQTHQYTQTQDWADEDGMFLCTEIRQYAHHRVAQELAFPLRTAFNSRELVLATNHAIECICKSYQEGWLHRDITPNNVMLDQDGNGVLNDWDRGIKIEPGRQTASARSGTWQFTSVALGETPGKWYHIMDDIEACYWMMLYNSIHFFQNTADRQGVAMFDYRDNDHAVELSGSKMKATFVMMMRPITFSSPPLNRLLAALQLHFRGIYALEQLPLSAGVVLPDTSSQILNLFAEALASKDWPTVNDAVDDLHPGRTMAQMTYAERVQDQLHARARKEIPADPTSPSILARRVTRAGTKRGGPPMGPSQAGPSKSKKTGADTQASGSRAKPADVSTSIEASTEPRRSTRVQERAKAKAISVPTHAMPTTANSVTSGSNGKRRSKRLLASVPSRS